MSNFNWKHHKNPEGCHGVHHALHVMIGSEDGWSWRVHEKKDGWLISFGWLSQTMRMGESRRTLSEAKAAVEVAAEALGHRPWG